MQVCKGEISLGDYSLQYPCHWDIYILTKKIKANIYWFIKEFTFNKNMFKFSVHCI